MNSRQYLLRKLLHNLLAVVVLLLLALASHGWELRRGGWFLSFLGSIYLLLAWLNYLRIKGFHFPERLRGRTNLPPFSQRGQGGRPGHLSSSGLEHPLDDDLDEAGQDAFAQIPLPERYRLNIYVYLGLGVLGLLLSAFL